MICVQSQYGTTLLYTTLGYFVDDTLPPILVQGFGIPQGAERRRRSTVSAVGGATSVEGSRIKSAVKDRLNKPKHARVKIKDI